MEFKLKKCALIVAAATGMALPALSAYAGGTITFGQDQYVSVGFGMRASYTGSSAGNGGTSNTNNFSLDSARLYLSGSLNQYVKGMLNTEKDIAGEGFQVIDGNVQLAVLPEVTIWAGRFLSPSDRANMAGPYYSLGGGYWSGIASRYGFNGGYIGRDDGVAAVGTFLDGKVSYALGAFEGNTAFKIAPVTVGTRRTGSDDLMYAGRVQVDFWDPEPGYYGTGNYLGGKDILAVGIAGRQQGGGSVSTTRTGDYSSYSIDFLLEKKDFGPGAISLEAAYYDYDTDSVFVSEQGKAYSAAAGYIFNDKVGWGKFQPFIRWQRFNADGGARLTLGSDTKKYDLGTAYIIDGYNAQLSAYLSGLEATNSSTKNSDSVNVAMQFQF